MCLGVPMRLIEVNYPLGVAEARGVKRTVYLQLLPENEIKEGDYVIVHVGFAIQRLSASEAEETWRLLEGLLEGS
ncbi:HypC/HybG/HupF family hydrogenase formation chaperone [Thermosulfuriphilus ammonigenes]|uniref:HypC/HybG/HupF family hydrogenase formation chaperone n=1 Tax=Thermosulfuriphilus ammonigenes TaxID=1936021 RepID=A0A6G7PVJ1_9BACT|nr:HypC/HybG/HupF family hydrogenase formation chaperone [Thermosulfuriphilus ammonigenes]MBA2848125.1 hydrogenase expression/formation protein HypC [Thermosulfuriphilus ammonigenes]QIJ71699.1 HypC/HybG/HupF family hydrogenase formation chaperone [Thermosulfuriphilus ammonigenes]HFB83630.1 HypC/HybG/HupF family hydrogenase formation chaperone [Thermodesulfatator sp.]